MEKLKETILCLPINKMYNRKLGIKNVVKLDEDDFRLCFKIILADYTIWLNIISLGSISIAYRYYMPEIGVTSCVIDSRAVIPLDTDPSEILTIILNELNIPAWKSRYKALVALYKNIDAITNGSDSRVLVSMIQDMAKPKECPKIL